MKISREQFAIFRLLFGFYLCCHFIAIIPYAAELYSRVGVIANPSLNPTYSIFPSIFWISDDPRVATYFTAILSWVALCFAVGFQRKLCALILWFGWACLFNRNNLTSNPSLPYVGLMLILTLFVPSGEGYAVRAKRRDEWFFPREVFYSFWIALSIGYTFSGLIKLQSPSWVNGTAFHHLLTNPLSRPSVLRDVFLALPAWAIPLLTWPALAGELLFLPLSLFRRGRCLAWCVMLSMHLGILTVVAFADLTLAMLLAHFFVFHPSWLPARTDRRKRTLFYDGECGLCSRSVQTLLDLDQAGIIRYSPLQGTAAKALLPEHLRQSNDLGTVVYLREHASGEPKLLLRSTAVLALLSDIGGMWRVASWLRIIPRPIRDFVYGIVARNRHSLFPTNNCRLPTASESTRFVD